MIFNKFCSFFAFLFFFLSLFIQTNGCENTGKTRINFKESSWHNLPGWYDDDFLDIWNVFLNNCKHIKNGYKGIHRGVSCSGWDSICSAAFDFDRKDIFKNNDNIRFFLEEHLLPWTVLDNNNKMIVGTMTGYYEPLLSGSRQKIGKFKWPIFGVPSDLVNVDLSMFDKSLNGKIIRGKLLGNRLIPYDSREEIINRINDMNVIAWVDDAFDSISIGTQGSGKILLHGGEEDGEIISLGYSSSNGHPFVSIISMLANKEKINPSAKSVKNWIELNPMKVGEILNKNPSVIFFSERKIKNEILGPVGSYGIDLTPKRSVAVDSNFIPLGSIVFILSNPQFPEAINSRFLFAQDTGSLIKGLEHIDIFWGFGADAEMLANKTSQSYNLWILWPKKCGIPHL